MDKYFNHYFRPTASEGNTEVELVALSDEEDSANVLKLLKDRIVVFSLKLCSSSLYLCRKTSLSYLVTFS